MSTSRFTCCSACTAPLPTWKVLLISWNLINANTSQKYKRKEPSSPVAETMARGSTLVYRHPKAGLLCRDNGCNPGVLYSSLFEGPAHGGIRAGCRSPGSHQLPGSLWKFPCGTLSAHRFVRYAYILLCRGCFVNRKCRFFSNS